MIRPLIIVLLVLGGHASALIPIKNVRVLFEKAATDEKTCMQLLDSLKKSDPVKNPVHYGYWGAVETISAQYAVNPYTKWSTFDKGKAKLEKVIAANPSNIELIYLRFTVQCGAPSFLGYNQNINTDKRFLIDHLREVYEKNFDHDLFYRISKYLEQAEQLTDTEKNEVAVIKKTVRIK